MDIIRLKPGTPAPIDADSISIDRTPFGRFTLTGSALSGSQSVAMVDGPDYSTSEEAEAEGLAWAEQNGVAELYVSVPRD